MQDRIRLISCIEYHVDTTYIVGSSNMACSDGSSLRRSPGSAQAQRLEGLLELGFCRLDPSIGSGQASGSNLRSQARARLGLRI